MYGNEEIAKYRYDVFGKCTVLNPDGTENTEADFIGNINPIRWKSMYCDVETGFYYIDGRYYSPEIRRYLSASSPETMLDRATAVFGLNAYLITLDNCVNTLYNGYTIESGLELAYDPEQMSEWTWFWSVAWPRFWSSDTGKVLAVGLLVLATVATAVVAAATCMGAMAWAAFASAMGSTAVGLTIGAAVSGFQSKTNGGNFWEEFADYVNENWALSVAITSVSIMVSYAVQAAVGNICFIAGTLVLCRGEDGKECHKPIEEIEVGDMVWAYDEETGEQAWKPVVRLFRNQTKEWYHVFVNGEEIVCTAEHPFYVVGKGFVPAKALTTKDKLVLSDNSKVGIDKIEIEKLDAPETTYNFEVADFHTYYVSESNVLVHNTCETTNLYRVMSDKEYGSLTKYGKFKHIKGTMQDKWFLTSYDDALEWSKLYYPDGGFKIVKVTVPKASLSNMYFHANIDGIGMGYAAHYRYLNEIMISFGRVL